MLPSWVDDVWKASQTTNVNANSPTIIRKYKCPCFHKLKICSTGLNSKQRIEFTKLVVENGGEMVGRLNLKETDILICHGVNGTTSEKFKAARKVSHIYCVTIEWIYDSIEKGYALSHKPYEVKVLTSTPTKGSENVDPNFSVMSAIGGPNNTQRSQINETLDVGPKPLTETLIKNKKRKASADLVDGIDLKKIKGAGQFLDGCSIFVAGFDLEQRDKLNKIVNLSGATRYDDISDRITHVIVGDAICQEVINIKSMGLPCVLVTLQWLLDSVELQRPAPEEQHLLKASDFEKSDQSDLGSPLSKKALNLLKTKSIVTENELNMTNVTEVSREEHDETLQQYIKPKVTEPEEDTLAMLLKNNENPSLQSSEEDFSIKRPKAQKSNQMEFKPSETSTQLSAVSSDVTEENTFPVSIFENLTFVMGDLDEEIYESLKEVIENLGGSFPGNNYKGIIDYAIVPAFSNLQFDHTAKQEVNELWIHQCFEEKTLVDVQYYHKRMNLADSKTLESCVVTLSGFTGCERLFLTDLIAALGGIPQDQFSRKTIESKNVLASTHLVSQEAAGKKYEAAMKWNLPVVSKEWLLECARTGTKAAENAFVIGESNVSDTYFEENDSTKTTTKSNTTVTPAKKSENNSAVKTPVNQIYKMPPNVDTPETYSQVTPINKIVQDAIDNNLIPTPPSPKTYYPWDPKTPDTPIGAFIRPNPSPHLRKEMQKYINSFPDFEPPKRRLSTPLSELKRRLMDKVLGRGMYADGAGPSTQELEEHKDNQNGDEESPDLSCEEVVREKSENNKAIDHKLQKFQEMLMASGTNSGPRRSSRMFESTKNLIGTVEKKNEVQSQVCTVGWDYGEGDDNVFEDKRKRVFMISGIESSQRERISKQIESLGGTVSNTSYYDPSSTHLLCSKPGRNEKTLGCIAAGKWVLHVSYVDKCVESGKFLDEEEFEFGNAKSYDNIQYDHTDVMMQSVHHWRTEIKRRGYGAFNDMRAIVIAEKRDPIVKVIEAGGGVVINVTPPFEETIHATHCLLEAKMIKDHTKFIPLAKQGIKCYNTIYIDHYLRRMIKDSNELLIPELAKYYQDDDVDEN